MEVVEKMIDEYAKEYKIEMFSYQMMGKMLEINKMKERLHKFHIKKLYIYGGGYLGIQLYNSINNFVNVSCIVDKSGDLVIDEKNIPVCTLNNFINLYQDEYIIITTIRYYNEVKTDLKKIVPEDKIIFLGEFLEGII